MEYWSADKKAIKPFTITPTLQYSDNPKLIQFETSCEEYFFLGL
jgi:hypothetical protein